MTKKKNINADIETPKNKEKWELLGFTDRYHYQGFNSFNGLDPTPYQEEYQEDINPEDLEKLLAIFGMEDKEITDEDFYENNLVADASFVSDYVGSNTIDNAVNNDY